MRFQKLQSRVSNSDKKKINSCAQEKKNYSLGLQVLCEKTKNSLISHDFLLSFHILMGRNGAFSDFPTYPL